MSSNETSEAYFHLFQGHVFGLHPAGGDFICTQTGSELLGALAEAPQDLQRFRRFLNGMLITIFDYAQRNQVCKELRKKQPELTFDGNLENVEAEQIQRKTGRRRTEPRDSDDD